MKTNKKLKEEFEDKFEVAYGIDVLDDAREFIWQFIEKALQEERESVVGQFYDFAREIYQEPFYKYSASPSEKWKRSGELRLAANLNRFCKELSKQTK